MARKCPNLVLGVGIVLTSVMISNPLEAQAPVPTLSGVVRRASGEVVPGARVLVKSTATGQTTETKTNAAGEYAVPGLVAGAYEMSISAEGFATKLSQLTISGEATETRDVTLDVGQASQAQPQAPGNTPQPKPPENLPNAPSSTPAEPTLEDLGFSPEQTRGNVTQQALLDKRTHMLKVHQRLGLITTGPMIATVITSLYAGGRSTSTTSRDVHVALGSLTTGLYFTTAYFAIRAPRVPGTETKGPIRVHKILAWIHGPGMVMTPILGAIAFDQKSKGEKVHGIAQAHGPVAIVTAGAFGAALMSVTLKF